MPSYGGGLSAQLMVAQETTVGTAVTVTTAYEMLDESLVFVPKWLDSAGLKAGQAFKRASRTSQVTFDVNGALSMEHSDAGHMGLLWKHALGSTITVPTQIGTTGAYKQIHTPGAKSGLSLTMQAGRPQATNPYTVHPFTYRGVKMLDWEFSCSDGQLAQMKYTLDGWQETTSTALAVASYSATAGVFTFVDAANFKLGGTATTTSGETSVSGGVPITTLAKGVTITGATPLAQARYGLGSAGVKAEQIDNGIPTVMISLDGEFTNRTEFYDVFKANTTVPFQIDFAHGDAGGGNAYLVSFIFPACKIKDSTVSLNGPDILGQKIDLEAYDDGSGSNPVVQCKIISTDTTL